MPTENKLAVKDSPGLSSIYTSKDVETDVTKIGSRRRVDAAPKVEKKAIAVSKPTPAKGLTPTPKPVAKVTKEVESSKAAPMLSTKSSFTIGKNKYYVIDDNTKSRNMITWDEEGNVSPNSPVQIIGQNANGGFILAANKSSGQLKASSFPYSKETGISFPSLKADVGGATPLMQSIHGGTYGDLSEVYDPKATAELRGMHKRTGRY